MSSLKAGVGLILGSACQGHYPAFACFSHIQPQALSLHQRLLRAFWLHSVAWDLGDHVCGALEQVRYTILAWGGLNLAVGLRLKDCRSLSAL